MAPPYIEPKQHLLDLFRQAMARVAPAADTRIELDRPKQATHGDLACNAAMQLARILKRNPREVAADLVAALPPSEWVDKVEIAGPGFINVFFKPAVWQALPAHILARGAEYGRLDLGRGERVHIEYVSANPTGPLHVGHGRGAAYGASLANLLAYAGYDVTREFYINDAGRQMDILAVSTWLRYLELTGEQVPYPPNAYQGGYVRAMAKNIHSLHGERFKRGKDEIMTGVPPVPSAEEYAQRPNAKEAAEAALDALIAAAKRLLGQDYDYLHGYVLEEQLSDCRNDLTEFGVNFDHWYSERTLHDAGLIERALARLAARGHLYEQDGATWFRACAFGDEKDRVVRRENGQYTYFAADIAYHLNKFERGFARVIDVWGADHHGYIPRVKGALSALGLDPDRLTVALVQFAVLYRNGQKVSMSTRAGEYVTLRELRREVGNDACRFFYVLRKSDQHLDFDLDLAKSQSTDNPVYYIQYAHARISSVLAAWGGVEADLLNADASLLTHPDELALLRRLGEFPDTIAAAAGEHAPHLIAYYLKDLAADLHGLYVSCQFLVEDKALRLARLQLIAATRRVLRTGLTLLGVSAPDKM